ncbi:MAG: flagellar hook-basal body complex protein [Nitrospinae bacterium]|nr:flagellar hook-basal body complex protein [Nitrospinota bacterium]
MIQGIRSALSGLQAFSRKASVNANNLANVNSPGFKAGTAGTQETAPGGTRVASVGSNQSQGAIVSTGSGLDLAIQGNGFFQVSLPNGQTAFSRNGSLKIDGQGRLTDAGGNPMKPPVSIPGDATSITVGRDGAVSATTPNGTKQVGTIQLASFNNPSGLRQGGGGLSFETAASGQPVTGAPGSGSLGTVTAGALESSNVDISTEMVGLIENRTGFTAQTKMIKVADEMMKEVLNLKA